MRKRLYILSMYNGVVRRGVESWVSDIATELTRLTNFEFDVFVIQGGQSVGTPPFHVRTVEQNALDRSGQQSMTDKAMRRVGWHASDCENREFLRRSVQLIVPELEDCFSIIMPMNGNVRYLKRLLAQHSVDRSMVQIVGVGHAGIPRDVGHYDAFVALSDRDAFKLRGQSFPLTTTIPNGVHIAEQPSVERAVVRVEKGFRHPIVLVVSALVPYKRVDLAMQAFAYLPQGSLWVVGEGPERSRLVELGRRIRSSNGALDVSFFGTVDRDQMAEIYDQADVFVHCADASEAFGIVILEAMARGLPVLVNDDPVRRALVPEQYLMDPRKSGDLAAKIQMMYQKRNRLRRDSIQAAARFDWTVVAQQYVDFFRQLVP